MAHINEQINEILAHGDHGPSINLLRISSNRLNKFVYKSWDAEWLYVQGMEDRQKEQVSFDCDPHIANLLYKDMLAHLDCY